MTRRTRPFWNEASEMLCGKELAALRLEKLRRQVAYCAKRSPFYAELFRQAGIQPDTIESVEQWKDLPVLLDKPKLRECQDASLAGEGHAFGSHLCAPLAKVVSVFSTSGTTGTPTFYCYTKKDLRAHAEMCKRVFWRTGLRPGDSILWGFGLGGFVATSLLPVLADMGVRVIPVGAEAGTEKLVQFARLTKPDTLIGSPSFLKYLIESVPERTGKAVSHLGIRRIITGSEPGAGLPEIRKRLLDAYDAPIFDMYGPANQFAFVSCGTETYHGMHVLAGDYGIWDDLRDPLSGEPVPFEDGAVGNMILTELEKEAAPYLRYAMDDVIEISIGECECGIVGPRIRVVGRADDMLIVKGVNVFPAAIQNVLAGFIPEVTGALKIHLDRPPPLVTPPLRLTVEYGEGTVSEALPALARRIIKKTRELLTVSPEITFLPPASLGRSTRKTPLLVREDLQGGKAQSAATLPSRGDRDDL